MADKRPNVLIACDERVRHGYLSPEQLVRLDQFADWEWFPCEGGGIYSVSEDTGVKDRLKDQLDGVDGLVVCHGAPRIDAELMDRAPQLRFIGELEGDRFAARIDLEAAWSRSIRTVDTTNGSSYPVAEWALALTLIAMRNAGKLFRRLIAGDTSKDMADIDRMGGVLTGKRVGLIGCGHMGRRLISLLRPFNGEIWVYDPYLPREMAEALDFLQTSLGKVLSECDAVVCLAPLTPQTKGMIGKRELDMIAPGTALVNVSRGPIIDSKALIDRLKRGDITAGLDVFDPEPIPPDSEILQLPNVFLTPHFSGRTGAEYPQFFQLMVDDLYRFFSGHETYYDLTPSSRANRQGEP